MSYDNSNSGFIGTNKRKREGKKDPDIQGTCEVGGVEYWISGWRNSKGYGLKFKAKEQGRGGQRKPAPSPTPAPSDSFDDDEIPF